MEYLSILIGKLILKQSRFFNIGSGSTWPGHIALKIDPNFIKKTLNKNNLKIILIAGTNGKTTTTKALSYILESHNKKVITNNSGANLLNGLSSTLVQNIGFNQKLNSDVLLFEVDENSLPQVLNEIPNPDAIILLDLFRDQLDRYGEVNIIAEKWIKAMNKLDSKTLVIANSDDPQIAFIASHFKNRKYFTIDDKYKTQKKLSHAVDSTTCPKCQSPLKFSKISYSHLGNYECTKCNFKNPDAQKFEIKTTLFGIYNLYNLTSAVITAEHVFGINTHTSLETLTAFKAAFGRQEIVDVEDKKVMLLLSKNPTGFNESLKVAIEKSETILILLNDKIPDGRDISWIWDVDFEILQNKKIKVFVSGDRSFDMANRLEYAGIPNTVSENFESSYKKALDQTTKDNTLTILPTYSAMLEVRKLISGKAIL